MSLAYLLKLAQALGSKLPLAWPHLMVIVAELKTILSLLGVTETTAAARFGASADGGEARQFEALCEAHGIDATEARAASSTFNAIGSEV